MSILFRLLEFIGIGVIEKIFLYFRERYLHGKKSNKILDNPFFLYMEKERSDLLPYWIINHKGRQALIRVFFPIKVGVFLDNMRQISKKSIKNKKLEFKSEQIYSMVNSYNRQAKQEWSKLYPGNKSMDIFCSKFEVLHKGNIDKTVERIQYILDKDICDMEKLDQILDALYWAFKLSLPAVLDGATSLNGDLTKELGLIIIEQD